MEYLGLPELDTLFDVSIMFSDLTGDDMDGAYGSLLHGGVGVSLGLSDRTRFFAHLSYGQSKGDPYHEIDGFSDEDGLELKSIPLLIGLKANLSNRTAYKLYLGAGFQYAWVSETLTTGDSNGNPVTLETTGSGTGYYFSFGPEFPLGKGSSSLGSEVALGGTRGSLKEGSHRHDFDLTGVHGRIYFSFGL